MDVKNLSGWLDQRPLILACPLDLSAHSAVHDTIHGFSGPNGLIILEKIGSKAVGVIHDPIGIHSVKVILQIGQE